MKSQKAAVCATLLAVLEERGVTYTPGSDHTIKSVLTPEDLKATRAIIKAGLVAEEIVFSEKAKIKFLGSENDSKLNSYVSGLVNNHIKKTKEFNMGVTYKPTNPGSRAGSGDDTVKALKALLKKTPATETELVSEIQVALAERIAEIKPEAKIEINVEALPEQFKHLV